jgi:hypothetical protein
MLRVVWRRFVLVSPHVGRVPASREPSIDARVLG